MIDELFELYDMVTEKEKTLNLVVNTLGADMNSGFLLDEIDRLEWFIVKAYGGNEGNYKHIKSTDLFYEYGESGSEQHKKELVDYIKLTIKNDWKGEVESTFIKG